MSGYQPANVPWGTATNNGVRFGWTKATEGTGYVNPNFIGQITGATNAKVYIGAYHYYAAGLHPNLTGANSADSEAAYFWSVAGPYIKYGGAYLIPCWIGKMSAAVVRPRPLPPKAMAGRRHNVPRG